MEFTKRVLNFVHLEPPHLSDAIFKCLNKWGIENKVYTISVDNAADNYMIIRSLKEILSRKKNLLCREKLFHV